MGLVRTTERRHVSKLEGSHRVAMATPKQLHMDNKSSQELKRRRVQEASRGDFSESRLDEGSVRRERSASAFHFYAQQLRRKHHVKGETYKETTSGGKVCGTLLMLSHKALSLVHVHPAGHRGCLLPLRLSAERKSAAAQSSVKLKPRHDAPSSPILSRFTPEPGIGKIQLLRWESPLVLLCALTL